MSASTGIDAGLNVVHADTKGDADGEPSPVTASSVSSAVDVHADTGAIASCGDEAANRTADRRRPPLSGCGDEASGGGGRGCMRGSSSSAPALMTAVIAKLVSQIVPALKEAVRYGPVFP